MTRKPATNPITLDDVQRLNILGLRVVSFQHQAKDGLWLPRDIIGMDGKTLIRWDTDDGYAFHGWAPWHDGMHGGRYETLGACLKWVQCAVDIRAGRATTF